MANQDHIENATSHHGPLVMDILTTTPEHIDRRNATRTVPMKLLCLGLSRTGTQSLREALFRLGYNDVYHQTNFNQNRDYDAQMWVEAYRKKFEVGRGGSRWDTAQWRRFFDAALGHCMAVSDVPCVTFWRELMEAYPEAKILITVRDSPEAWYASIMETVMFMLGGLFGNGWRPWMVRRFMPTNPSMEYTRLLLKYDDACSSCFQDHLHGTRDGIYAYSRHNAAVQALAKQQGREVLIFNVKQGWKPLSDWLGVDQPEGLFPRLNDKVYFVKRSTVLHRLALLGTAIGAAKWVLPISIGFIAVWYGMGRTNIIT